MVFLKRLHTLTSARISVMHNDFGLSVSKIHQTFPNVSRATIYRHIKEKVGGPKRIINKMGRPSKLNHRQERDIVRTVKKLRKNNVNFTAKEVRVESGCTHVSYRTVVRKMNENGYNHLQARKKGVLSDKDKKLRVKFGRDSLRDKSKEYWQQDISFYLDGVGLVHKTNPLEGTKAPKARVWRKKCEGLQYTSKGTKAGYGGRVANFMVAISFNKGVVCCELYEKMDGKYFESFIRRNFECIYEKSNKTSRIFVQDGDPSQNSKLAKAAMKSCNFLLQQIPARSPDLNPIENVFHIVKKDLQSDAVENKITHETYTEFCNRAKRIMENVDIKKINNIIASMHSRIVGLIKCKGCRLRY